MTRNVASRANWEGHKSVRLAKNKQ